MANDHPETTTRSPLLSSNTGLDFVASDPDPPPPYPSRPRRPRRHPVLHLESDNETDGGLSSSSPRAGRRNRSLSGASSHFSSASVYIAPSLGNTLVSLFHPSDDEDDDINRPRAAARCRTDEQTETRPLLGQPLDHTPDYMTLSLVPEETQFEQLTSTRPPTRTILNSSQRYFRPLGRAVYWNAFFHLAVINFPFALLTWVFLFVLTVAGTTLLVALPIGAILCFLNLIGARAFARAELHIQTKFHTNLAYPAPYPARPIFNRHREATIAEIEAGRATAGGTVPETSFYRNCYSMFTDPTTYQSLFYFLVIKPAITLTLTLFIIIFIIPCVVLIIPAPPALRSIRRLGVWQANIAVEGLYFAVR